MTIRESRSDYGRLTAVDDSQTTTVMMAKQQQ